MPCTLIRRYYSQVRRIDHFTGTNRVINQAKRSFHFRKNTVVRLPFSNQAWHLILSIVIKCVGGRHNFS